MTTANPPAIATSHSGVVAYCKAEVSWGAANGGGRVNGGGYVDGGGRGDARGRGGRHKTVDGVWLRYLTLQRSRSWGSGGCMRSGHRRRYGCKIVSCIPYMVSIDILSISPASQVLARDLTE